MSIVRSSSQLFASLAVLVVERVFGAATGDSTFDSLQRRTYINIINVDCRTTKSRYVFRGENGSNFARVRYKGLQRILFQHYFEEKMHDAQKNINQRSILYKLYVANKRHTFHEVIWIKELKCSNGIQ